MWKKILKEKIAGTLTEILIKGLDGAVEPALDDLCEFRIEALSYNSDPEFQKIVEQRVLEIRMQIISASNASATEIVEILLSLLQQEQESVEADHLRLMVLIGLQAVKSRLGAVDVRDSQIT